METTQILYRTPAVLWLLVVLSLVVGGADWMAFVEATDLFVLPYALLGVYLEHGKDIAV